MKFYVNGKEAPARVLSDKLTGDAETRTNTPLRLGQRSAGMVFEEGQIQDLRIFARTLSASETARIQEIPALQAALAAGAKRNPQQTESLFAHYLASRDAAWQDLDRTVAKLEGERDAIKGRSPVTHIQEEKKNSPAMANILARGAYDQVGEAVAAAPPSVLHDLPPELRRTGWAWRNGSWIRPIPSPPASP